MNRRRVGVTALWLVCVAAAGLVVAHARYITDLSAFLPAKPSAAQRLLVDQLRDGPASRLILAAIAGGNDAARAQASIAVAARVRRDPQFAGVDNGEPVTAERDRRYLFEHRYLLSDAVTAARFSATGLHAAIQDTIDGLASPAGLLLESLLPDDPTGEMLHILDGLERTPSPSTHGGVWVSADGGRALLVAQTAAAGSDTDAQQRAIETIRGVFAAAVHEAPAAGAAQSLRLTLTGPAVFAVAARAKIEQAAIRLSIASSILVVTLLLAVYRSPTAVLLGLAPVASGALIGIAAVALGFGAVHGVTLGFGITLIGESVDYAIYFFVQSHRRRQDPAARSWQQAWWPTIRLGVLTSVCGFASLLPSGFPGLAQLGLYSIGGLVAAALVTRFVLPALLPDAFVIHDVAPLGQRIARLLRPARALPGGVLAAAGLALAAAAFAVLWLHRGTLWNRELAALSPVSAADQDTDARLRADLGAADVRDLVIVTGPTLEAVLVGAERAGQALQPLADAGTIGGFDSPVNYLPSLATQTRRRDSLPPAAQLRENLRQASAGLGLRDDLLQPFLSDVEAARRAPLLTPQDLRGTSLETGFDALILHQRDRWNALLPLHAAPMAANAGTAAGAGAAAGAVAGARAIDTARVAAALEAAQVPGAQALDLKRESDLLYANYLAEAIHMSLGGMLAIVVLLLIALRSVVRVVRVLMPLLLAVLTVAAGLALCGVQLTILHLVGMLLIVAVGSNYALFFDRQASQHETSGESLTLASLVIANTSTVIGFGLLCFAQVPVLVALGSTVAPGTLLALLFAALLAGRSPAARSVDPPLPGAAARA